VERNIFKFCVLSFIGLIFVGCAATAPQTTPLPKVENQVVEFGILKTLDGKVITSSEINMAILNYIKSNSKYEEAKKTQSCFNNLGGGVTCSNYAKGVLYSSVNNGYKIDYVKGHAGSPTYSVSFNIPGTTSTTQDKTTLIFSYPENYASRNDYFATANAQPLDTESNLIADINSIFQGLSKASEKAFVSKQILLKDEVNTNYNDASTFANFERLLGVYAWKDKEKPTNIDIAKEKYFSFKTEKGTILPLHIKVYPYKNGSKVVYDMEVPYHIFLNGTYSFNDSDMKKIKDQIAKIAND
jgi:hypothetical protein